MRKIVIAIVVVLIILSLGIVEQLYVKDTLVTINAIVDEIIASIKDDDMQSARFKAIQLDKFWNEKSQLLELLLPHNEFKDMPELMGELSGSMYSSSDEVLVTLYRIKYNVAHHMDILLFDIYNIL